MKKMKKKSTKIYARISKDDKELIIDFDEDVTELARRWGTTRNAILSSIAHHYPTYERIIVEEQ